MELRREHSQAVEVATALRTYPGTGRAAILLIRAGDDATLTALARVFALHRASRVDLEHAVPAADRTAGDCVLRDDGITVPLGGVTPAAWNGGRGMLGLTLAAAERPVPPRWRRTALEEGCVWAALLFEATYRRILPPGADQPRRLPTLPTLRLAARSAE